MYAYAQRLDAESEEFLISGVLARCSSTGREWRTCKELRVAIRPCAYRALMPRYRPKAPQIVRCIALLVAMAHARRGVQLRPFYARRKWNTRTAYRDLDYLRAVPVPVEEPERGWYRVPAAWLPPTTLNVTSDELSALAIAAALTPAMRNTAIGRALQALRAKLGSAVSAQAQLDLEPISLTTRVPAIDYEPHRASVDAICAAVERRVAVRLVYRDARANSTTRVVEPCVVHYEPTTEALYVIAWCRLRESVRTFAIHRIVSAELLDEPCSPRPQIALEMANAMRVWTRPGTEHVVLRFAASVSAEVRERRWHGSQIMRDLDDGGVELELDIAAPEELERTLLGYASDVEVVEPECLAGRLRERHAAAAAATRIARFPTLHARRHGSTDAVADADGEGEHALATRVIG